MSGADEQFTRDRGDVAAALEKSGCPKNRATQAAAILVHEQRIVRASDGALLWAEGEELGKGLAAWAQTDEGKVFVPPQVRLRLIDHFRARDEADISTKNSRRELGELVAGLIGEHID